MIPRFTASARVEAPEVISNLPSFSFSRFLGRCPSFRCGHPSLAWLVRVFRPQNANIRDSLCSDLWRLPQAGSPSPPFPAPARNSLALEAESLALEWSSFQRHLYFSLLHSWCMWIVGGEKSIKEKIKTTRTTMTHRLPSTFRYRKINTEKKSFHCEMFSCYFSLRRSHDDFLIIINTFKPFKIIFISLCLQKWYMFVAQKSNNGDVYGTEHKSPHSLLLD